LIGRRFDDPTVKKDMESWPFKVIDDGNNNPKVEVEYLGETKSFSAQEISSMVLTKVGLAANSLCRETYFASNTWTVDEGDSRGQAWQEG
jgi:molecular chaperone DnaK (HSP70)